MLADTPVATPDDEPIEAILVLLLVHIPPVVESDKDIVDPAQTPEAPVIKGTYNVVLMFAETVVLFVHPEFVAVTV